MKNSGNGIEKESSKPIEFKAILSSRCVKLGKIRGLQIVLVMDRKRLQGKKKKKQLCTMVNGF